MAKRVVIAGILGGVVIFLWGYLAHTVLGLGEVGIKELSNEQAVVGALRASTSEPGLYFFPGVGMTTGASPEQMRAAMQKAAGGPYGIVIWHPSGAEYITPRRLGVQFGLNVVQALFAAILLSCTTGLSSYVSRVGFVFLAGLLAALSTNIEYWNWYSFPSNYTLGYMATQIIGFLLAGFVVAGFVKRSSSGMPA